MKTRIIIGLLLIAAAVGVLWLDHWLGAIVLDAPGPAALDVWGLPVAIVVLLMLTGGFVEMAQFGFRCETRILRMSGLFGTLLVGTLPFWWQFVSSAMDPPAWALLLSLAVSLILVFAEQMARYRVEDALGQLGLTALAILYLGVGAALVLGMRIRFEEYGIPVVVLFLAAVKATDIGAYFTGSFIGKHKIIPWLSPGKSWEGLAGGVASAAGVGVLVVWAMQISPLSLWQGAVFGGVIAIFGQYADGCESLLKRNVGVKDSAALVPSFGGVLDIVDSPLLSAPAAYLLLMLFWAP